MLQSFTLISIDLISTLLTYIIAANILSLVKSERKRNSTKRREKKVEENFTDDAAWILLPMHLDSRTIHGEAQFVFRDFGSYLIVKRFFLLLSRPNNQRENIVLWRRLRF
jgi:hypothetical protein